MTPRLVYYFADGSREMRDLLGGKGANVAEMTHVLGPDRVPAGFTITTEEPLAIVGELDTGLVRVNQPTSGVAFHAPFGGEKQSSFGPREQGEAARELYTSTHTITFGPARPWVIRCFDRMRFAILDQHNQVIGHLTAETSTRSSADYGGMKASGVGREGPAAYAQIRNVINMGGPGSQLGCAVCCRPDELERSRGARWGAQSIGMAPCTERDHFVQNLGRRHVLPPFRSAKADESRSHGPASSASAGEGERSAS